MSVIIKVTVILVGVLSGQIAFAAQGNVSSQPFCGSTNPSQAHDLNGITKVLYKIVSGKAGEEKNWALMRTLFAPNSTITPIFHNRAGHTVRAMSVEDFISLNRQIFANINFFETEVKANVFRYGNTATILSQYESRDDIGGAPYSTGVNSFQLVNDGIRWCVISVTWDSDKGPLPSSHFVIK